MSTERIATWLEHYQVAFYLIAIALGLGFGRLFPGLVGYEWLLNPCLGAMLLTTFLQLPFQQFRQAFKHLNVLIWLLVLNFGLIPFLLWLSLPFLPEDFMVRLGLVMILLCPCVDYVVTFAHMGKADGALLLAATPLLLLGQMLALPLWLPRFFPETSFETKAWLAPQHFLEPFVWLILLPLALSVWLQWLATSHTKVAKALHLSRLGPVPLTALVLFVALSTLAPQLTDWRLPIEVAPFYVVFAFAAALVGLGLGALVGLKPLHQRVLAFSGATRNALILMPIALALPNAIPVLPLLFVTQTLVELVCELVLVKAIPWLSREIQLTTK